MEKISMNKQTTDWSYANARLEYSRNYKDLREAKKQEYMQQETCENCGSTEDMEFHHVIPLIFRGSNELSNFKRLCKGCHSKLHGFIEVEEINTYNPFGNVDLSLMFSEFLHQDCDNCNSTEELKMRMVVPFCVGGQHVKGNFATLCTDCNQILDDNTDEKGIMAHSHLVKLGQKQALVEGKHMGRPTVNNGIKTAIVFYYMRDMAVKQLVNHFNYSESTIYKYKNRFDNLYDLEKTSDSSFNLVKKANGESKEFNLYKQKEEAL